MAITSGTSGNLYKTTVREITHNHFATTTGSANQTFKILENAATTLTVVVRSVIVWCAESWSPDTLTITVGQTGGNADRYTLDPGGSTQGSYAINSGAFFALSGIGITQTTVGANTGTSGAGLSLIGNTTSVDQAANLMNDLVALQEDITALEAAVSASTSGIGIPEELTAGAGIQATLTTDGTNWSDLTAGEYHIIIEYLDLDEVL